MITTEFSNTARDYPIWVEDNGRGTACINIEIDHAIAVVILKDNVLVNFDHDEAEWVTADSVVKKYVNFGSLDHGIDYRSGRMFLSKEPTLYGVWAYTMPDEEDNDDEDSES